MLPTLDKYLSILINTIYIFVQTCESDRFQLTNLSIVTILIFFISVLIFILCLITFNTLKVPKSLKLGKTLWSLKTFNSFCKIQRGYIKYPQVGVCTALHPLEALGAICSLLLPSSGGTRSSLASLASLACGHTTPISASVFTLPSLRVSCVCVWLHVGPIQVIRSLPLKMLNLITSAKLLLPNNIIFTGSRNY